MGWREEASKGVPKCFIESPIVRPVEQKRVAVIDPVRVEHRIAHEPGKMNGLEKRYAAHLEIRRVVGEIRSYKFEPLKLRLAPSTFYNVDFSLLMPDGRIELHETKGHWEDDARVKIKVAAAMFPEFKFVGVQWNRGLGDWKYEDFKA